MNPIKCAISKIAVSESLPDSTLWPVCNSAETGQLTAALHAQDARPSHQQEFQVAKASQLGQLPSQVRDLVKYLQQTTNPPIAPEHLATAATPVQVVPHCQDRNQVTTPRAILRGALPLQNLPY